MQFILDLITFEFSLWVLFALVFGISVAYFSPKPKSLSGKHVLITGGSSGIGKAIAVEVVKGGSKVTLLARDSKKLEEARTEIINVTGCDSKSVQVFSADVSGPPQKLQKVVQDSEEENGPIFMLVNCAGVARAGKLEDLTPDDFKWMMDVNFMGSVNVTKAVLPSMKERGEGIIVLVGSLAGLSGIFGYTAYSASKFALRGFAECLSMEVKPYNISVTMSCPPDTDTPGFADENKTKPKETTLIAGSVGLFGPEEVAKTTMSDACLGKFMSTNGFESWILTTLATGMSPVTSYFDLAVQTSLMGVCRLISAFYLIKFDGIIKAEIESKEKMKKN